MLRLLNSLPKADYCMTARQTAIPFVSALPNEALNSFVHIDGIE